MELNNNDFCRLVVSKRCMKSRKPAWECGCGFFQSIFFAEMH